MRGAATERGWHGPKLIISAGMYVTTQLTETKAAGESFCASRRTYQCFINTQFTF